MMVVRGLLTLDGADPAETTAAIPGIAGLGHIVLTVGLVSLFVALRGAVREELERRRTTGASLEVTAH